MSSERLPPLESNPDVLNKYMKRLGVILDHKMVDVMGLDSEMLSWVPKPVLAVLLLFPITEAYEKHKREEEATILSEGQNVSGNVFFLKQVLSNSCGTIALVHSVANNTDKIKLEDGWMSQFMETAKFMDPAARGAALENSEGIIEAHRDLANEGQTVTPGSDEPVNHHFIAFVHKDGNLYELDGRKPFPINHGPTTPETLLEDSAKICREFMARDPNEMAFTVMALAASHDE